MNGVHDWHISEREYARQEARRGRRHAFTSLAPERTALVVVDLVPFFLVDNGYARAILPNVNRLAAALRGAGGTVAWVLPSAAEPPPARVEFYGAEIAEVFRLSGGAGELRDRLCPELQVEPGGPGRGEVGGECVLPRPLAPPGPARPSAASTPSS